MSEPIYVFGQILTEEDLLALPMGSRIIDVHSDVGTLVRINGGRLGLSYPESSTIPVEYAAKHYSPMLLVDVPNLLAVPGTGNAPALVSGTPVRVAPLRFVAPFRADGGAWRVVYFLPASDPSNEFRGADGQPLAVYGLRDRLATSGGETHWAYAEDVLPDYEGPLPEAEEIAYAITETIRRSTHLTITGAETDGEGEACVVGRTDTGRPFCAVIRVDDVMDSRGGSR